MKRGKLGRRGRIFRNFLLAGVLGALIWACAGWPVPDRWELRRLEREALLSPHSQFQGSIQDSWGDEVLIGLTPRWLVMGSPKEFRLWPREGDGPVLAPVPEEFTLRGGIRVVAAGAPQGTASARLTLEVSHWYASFGGRSSYSSQREDILDGWPDSSPEYRAQTVTFSDGSSLEIPLVKSRKPQSITFEPRRVRSLVLSHLIQAEGPSPFPALTQIEAWGRECTGEAEG